ncbi:hypothetical protein M422DRAFT_56035 [Sphaerobolus stellatus SS14]|uniref:Uncharacterized protein n=1 Tax=Sphaerobolus stellatus (strain SS14) TaxID=990650 RepID=A0A0C9UIV6_SPHS4|nr:hypothetical protein M422DRAFT_56035 [Sphaerobolus stellatus SS14]
MRQLEQFRLEFLFKKWDSFRFGAVLTHFTIKCGFGNALDYNTVPYTTTLVPTLPGPLDQPELFAGFGLVESPTTPWIIDADPPPTSGPTETVFMPDLEHLSIKWSTTFLFKNKDLADIVHRLRTPRLQSLALSKENAYVTDCDIMPSILRWISASIPPLKSLSNMFFSPLCASSLVGT